jgi:hypothetical protein
LQHPLVTLRVAQFDFAKRSAFSRCTRSPSGRQGVITVRVSMPRTRWLVRAGLFLQAVLAARTARA